jgi:hypothetical protein
MAKKQLYVKSGSVAYDAMLKSVSKKSTTAINFREGDLVKAGGVAYPITRFDTLPFFMSGSGANMIAIYLANAKTLFTSPVVVGMGSSTMFGHGLSSPNRYWDKVTTWFTTNTTSPTLYNIGVEGINSASMQLTTAGGTAGQNLTTAFTYNPSIIVWDEPTNWATSYDENQQITYWLAAFNACLAQGVLLFFNSARPRGSLTTSQQTRLRAFNTLLAVHPILKYVSNIDGDTFWDTSTTYALLPTYDQGDATHLTSAGTTVLANDTVAVIQKVFRLATAHQSIEIHRSTDGTTYSLFDTITDFTNYKKTYSHLSGYYKSRGKLKDGSYTSFGTAIQITNTSPVANAGGSQSITLPTSTITLTGSGSDSDGTISSYLWTKLSGPSAGTITSPTSATTTVTGLTTAGSYVYRLTVTDNEGATGFNDAAITVSAAGNVPPTANAGADQTLSAGATTATLSGSGTDTDGTIAGYAWSQISGPNTAGITSASSASTGLTGLIAGVYIFRLTVTDNLGATGTDDVQITAVASVGQRILIDLGGDGIVDSGQTDGGIMTPSNAGASGAIPGQAGDGKWWNNIVSCVAGSGADYPGTAYPITINRSGIVDIANTAVAMTIRLDKAPRGTFSAIDYSMNYGGSTVAVSDYPISAVMDNLYFHTSSGITTMTFVIPAGKTASIKFWGNRNSTGPRILQIRKAGDTTWLEYDATTNTTYATAVTLTGITGTQGIEMQVKSGSTFGHISVIDITLT